ncbi:MAG TPA: SufD family Fe-S cluster assembly protein [bacterium]|nr:SufD family Fe-S cluster assembly protein [bacterium]
MSVDDTIKEIFASINMSHHLPEGTASVVIDQNKVLGRHLVPGLDVQAKELPDGIEATFIVAAGAKIEKPVHLCFGMLPEEGVQRIVMHVDIRDHAQVEVVAHCTFPNAVKVQHLMDADIRVGKHARYSYFERHVHGPDGGVTVVPKAKVIVEEHGRFKTEFELIKGRVGEMDIEYDVTGKEHSTIEMTARISGTKNDKIRINEIGHLVGEHARGVLNSYIAVRHQAQADIRNTLTASAPFARGHVDCKEIVQDEAIAQAMPVVKVEDPRAHITHEAAIGSVDSKQLETLMAHGLSEEQAVDLIIEGLLS